MRKLVICLSMLLGLVGVARAANLMDVYQMALQQDPKLQEAKHQLAAQKTQIGQARGQLLPSMDLSANTQWNKEDIQVDHAGGFQFPGGGHQYNSNGYTLQLTQPLFNMPAFRTFNQSKQVVRQAEIQYQAAQQSLILRVANAYFNVLLAQDELQTARAERQALLKQLDQAKREFQVGTASKVDVDEAQARYDQSDSSVISKRNQVQVARRQLAQIVGQPVTSLAGLTGKLPLQSPEPAKMQDWVQQARKGNLSVLAQREGVKIARSSLSIQKGNRYPTLSAVAFRDRATTDTFGTTRTTTTTNAVGLQLNWNLFSGGTRHYKIKQAAAQLSQSQSTLLDDIRQAEFNASQAYLNVQNSISQIKANRQSLKSSQTSLNSTKIGRRVGTRTIVDVLNSLQQVYTAQSNLYQARYNYLIYRLQLMQAVGQLQVSDLRGINSLLGPSSSKGPSPNMSSSSTNGQ